MCNAHSGQSLSAPFPKYGRTFSSRSRLGCRQEQDPGTEARATKDCHEALDLFRGTGLRARHLQGRALPAVSPAQAGVQEEETGSRPTPGRRFSLCDRICANEH